jgi:hypothetical protein
MKIQGNIFTVKLLTVSEMRFVLTEGRLFIMLNDAIVFLRTRYMKAGLGFRMDVVLKAIPAVELATVQQLVPSPPPNYPPVTIPLCVCKIMAWKC